MNRYWYQLRPPDVVRPIVVVDVSPAAQGLEPILLSTLEGLAEELPPADQPDVAFLGGSSRWRLTEFLAHAETLLPAQRGRGRVIAPLLDSFRGSWPSRVVILAVNPLIDLLDWTESPHCDRLVVVKLNPTINLSGGAFPEIDLNTIDEVVRLFDLPVQSVTIAIHGAIPFAWDQPAYHWHEGSLVAKSVSAWDVRIGVASEQEPIDPKARVVRGTSLHEEWPLEAIPAPREAGWSPLTGSELTLLHSWQAGRPFLCPLCRQQHSPGTIGCPGGFAQLFPSLGSKAIGHAVQLRLKMFRGEYRIEPGPVYLTDDTALVNTDSVTVWYHDLSQQRWQTTGERVPAFHRLTAEEIVWFPSVVEESR